MSVNKNEKHNELLNIDSSFKPIAETLCSTFNSMFAQITLLSTKQQWTYSSTCFDVTHYNQLFSVMNFTISEKKFVQLSDLDNHECFNDSAILVNNEKITFYAGIPLILDNGEVVGVISVMNKVSIDVDDSQKLIMNLLAKNIVSQILLFNKTYEFEQLQYINQLIINSTSDLISIRNEASLLTQANTAFIQQEEVASNKQVNVDNQSNSIIDKNKQCIQSSIDTFKDIVTPLGVKKTRTTKEVRFNNGGDDSYLLHISRDIDESQTINDTRDSLYQELDEFIHILSHDLKSPLNGIKNITNWIEEDDGKNLSQSSLEYFAMLKNSILRMTTLLNDLSDYSKAGRDNTIAETLNFDDVVNECNIPLPTGFELLCNKCEVFLPKKPLIFVLTQLISNAIKHHDKKSGVIYAECIVSTNQYFISVKDDGPGIESKLHKKIFLPFQKLKSKDEVEGSGLGLSLIKKTLRQYAGEIHVSSDIKQGSEFIVTWPRLLEAI